MNREDLQPGDLVLDSAGYPAIQHFGPGESALITSSHKMFNQAMQGRMPVEEYAVHVNHHVAIQVAYATGAEFPEGTAVRHDARAADSSRLLFSPIVARLFGQ